MVWKRPKPKLTKHAEERCREMGISQWLAQTIVMKADLTRCSRDAKIASNREWPDYAVVFKEETETEPALILSVVFKTCETYVRAGHSFRPAAS